MYGRRGLDEYSKFLLGAGLAAIVLTAICKGSRLFYFFDLLSWFCIIFAYARMVSRNITKRQMENLRYLQYKSKVTGRFQKTRKPHFDSNTGVYYKYFKCPQCGQNCRVPKNKGKIRITCPTCGNIFERRS